MDDRSLSQGIRRSLGGELPRLAVLLLRKIEAAGEVGQALTAFVAIVIIVEYSGPLLQHVPTCTVLSQ